MLKDWTPSAGRGGLQDPGPLSLIGPGLAELGGGDLGSRLVDEDAADPIGVFRLGNDLDVPVIVVADRLPVPLQDARPEVGRRVQGHLVPGVPESARECAEIAGKESRQVAEILRPDRLLERAAVLPRNDPRLERYARRVR